MMRRQKGFVAYSIFLMMLIFFGCSSAPKTEKEQTPQPTKKIVAWNNDDTQSISDSLVSSLLNADWKKKFKKKRKPIIVVGRIENVSGENIDVTLLAKDIERSLINSGEVSFIADKPKREKIRTNRKNSSDFPQDKFKKYLKSLKADYFIEGKINTEIDSTIIPIQKKYTMSLELLNTKNASVVWKGSQSIVK